MRSMIRRSDSETQTAADGNTGTRADVIYGLRRARWLLRASSASASAARSFCRRGRAGAGLCLDGRVLGLAGRRLVLGRGAMGAAAAPARGLGAWKMVPAPQRMGLGAWTLALLRPEG